MTEDKIKEQQPAAQPVRQPRRQKLRSLWAQFQCRGVLRRHRIRRKFLSLVGVMACATVRAQEKKVDGGLAVIEQKKIPRRTTPITPPGSLAVRNMEAHCTGCQLCVAVCPN